MSNTPYEPLAPVHVFDLHCDTLDLLGMRDHEPYCTMGCKDGDEGYTDLLSNEAAISLERMEDYAWCQCFAIWVPDTYRHHDASDFYAKARDYFYAQVARNADRVVHVRDARDIDQTLAQGKVAALLTVENTLPVIHSVNKIRDMAQDGVKMITLTWNGRNSVGSGNETNEGLTTFGREAIRAFEDEGIVVDVSHLNMPGFADLLDVVRRPFVASHSNSRAVCDVPRNLTDDQFRAIRDMGGLVGLNFCKQFITTRDTKATGDVTFDELAAHVEHFLDLGGENTVALGSDWDGCDVPAWLTTCDTAGDLHHKFAERFGPVIADRIFYTNARNFFVRHETA